MIRRAVSRTRWRTSGSSNVVITPSATTWRPPTKTCRTSLPRAAKPVPHYLSAHYWWAYVHPNAVKVFERQWLNYHRLRDAALAELGERLPGKTLPPATTGLNGRI